jgi:hypothetical protein
MSMGEKFEAWRNFKVPEPMYITRKFQEVAVAYEDAKNDPSQGVTQDELIAGLLITTQWAITQIEARLLALEGVDFVPPDWEEPAN